MNKKTETFLKTTFAGASKAKLSSIEPALYKERFQKFMKNQVLTVAHYLQKVQQPAGPVTKGKSQGFVKDMNYSMPKSLRWEPTSLAAGLGTRRTSTIEVPARPDDQPKTFTKQAKLGSYIKADYDIFAPTVQQTEQQEEDAPEPENLFKKSAYDDAESDKVGSYEVDQFDETNLLIDSQFKVSGFFGQAKDFKNELIESDFGGRKQEQKNSLQKANQRTNSFDFN